MNKISTENPILPGRQEEQKTHSLLQGAMISFACLTFFPLMYFLGRMVMNWVG